MIGLLINTWNRPEYLSECIKSVRNADLSGVFVLVVDDCSTDHKVFPLLSGFMIYRMDKNKSIRFALEKGMQILFDQIGCDTVINLDADAIVRPDFISKLTELSEQFPNDIITGFNTLIAGRHPIVSQHGGYCVKKTCGGINMLFTKSLYEKILKRALVTSQRLSGHWDDIVCKMNLEVGGKVICTTPSVVQHIGFKSAMGHNANPDYAEDFTVQKTNKMIVLQPHGLGDVIFSQTLVRSLGNYEITWPVLPQFVADCKRAYPDINFIPSHDSPVDLELKRDMIVQGYRVIPIRWSNLLHRVHYNRVMRAKYDMYKQNFTQWKHKAMWVRDTKKENDLFELLGLGKEPYTVVNEYFGSSFQYKVDTGVTGVQMRNIEGYSLFDWAKVLEGATEIHTVSTSILYILDILKTCPVHVYVRRPVERDHQNYRYLFTDTKFIYK